jgi:hypothetical protein
MKQAQRRFLARVLERLGDAASSMRRWLSLEPPAAAMRLVPIPIRSGRLSPRHPGRKC